MALRRKNALYAGTACPRCGVPLKHETLTSGTQLCPRCSKPFEAVHFLPVEPLAAVAEIAGLDPSAGAPCGKHARNKAEAACQRCGQFMCALCRIDADGKAYCPPCFERLSGEGALQSTATRLRNYGGLSLSCAILSFIFGAIVIGMILAPIGVYFGARGISQKRKLEEREGVISLILTIILNVILFFTSLLLTLAVFGVFR